MTNPSARDDTTGPTRRDFLVQAGAAGGALVLGWQVPSSALAQGAAAPTGTEVNLWVVVRPDNRCIVRIARSEMGQGTLTGLAQLVAEELECDWALVGTEQVSAQRNFAAKRAWGEMGTGGSRGIRTSHDYVRRGGAAARLMLLQAAANEWQVPVTDLRVAAGVITHPASGRRTTYGQVAGAAAKLAPPDLKAIKLKDPKTWTVAGQPKKRLDTGDKLDGSKTYAIDVRLPGMLCAAVKACPVYGGKLVSFDNGAIAGRRGVRGAVRVNDRTVAVVADTWWRAKMALDALPIVWDEAGNGSIDSAGIAARLKEGLETPNAYADRNEGDALAAIASAARKVEATYSTPFLAHATMEPMNCTARVTADKAECWVATQNAEAAHAALSESSGLPLAQCEVNRLDLGGVNYTVDAACASSLAALDAACKELRSGTSDLVLCGGADLHKHAVFQKRDAVSHAHRLFRIVGHNNGRCAALPQDRQRFGAHGIFQTRIETREWLVQQPHRRARHKRPRQRHPLLLAA